MQNIKLCTWAEKGGIGKSTLGTSLALDMGLGIVTKDPTKFSNPRYNDKILRVGRRDPFPLIDGMPVLYDLGGYIEDEIIPVHAHVDKIITVIATDNKNDLLVCLESVQSLVTRHPEKVIIVINRHAPKKGSKVAQLVAELFPDTPQFTIRYAATVTNVIDEAKSIIDLSKDGKQRAKWCASVKPEYQKLLNYLKKIRKENTHG